MDANKNALLMAAYQRKFSHVRQASMCSRFNSVRLETQLRRHFNARFATAPPVELKRDVFPGNAAPFVRRPREWRCGDEAVPPREAVVGLFGLLPHWAKDEKLTRSTYNARSGTVSVKPSFRDAWKKAQHCIIPAEAFYEPDWRSGKHVPTRIARADGSPHGIAGLWSTWRGPQGQEVLSFTMLTVNAGDHSVMRDYHRPGDEKRMIVLLREVDYDAWLDAAAQHSMDFMRLSAPETLNVEAEVGTAPEKSGLFLS